jgi:CPA1 family monovalent cation:H+ antiporter
LGAIVAPSDAAAAITVLRTLRPPRRIMVVLEGESLLNDATALLVYRLAATAALGTWAGWVAVPGLALSILGGVGLGIGFGWLVPRFLARITDVPTSLILQFFSAFALWTIADRLALSPVIATVSFAITLARIVPGIMSARQRIQSYAVWEVAVFVLNVLAFIMTGLQLRPVLAGLPDWRHYAAFAGAVLLTVVVVRMLWIGIYNIVARWRDRRYGVWKSPIATPPTIGSGVTVAWCGMRGIVTLATALALPEGEFPDRSLILFSAFITVLGTLVVQGLTLRPLMRMLRLTADGVVEREIRFARNRTAQAALESLMEFEGALVDALRAEYGARMMPAENVGESDQDGAAPIALPIEPRRRALAAERTTLLALRHQDAIGDDAFHAVEAELDWLEMFVEGRLDLTVGVVRSD